MAKITLSKALSLKKKLLSNLGQVREEVIQYNSVVKGGIREIECKEALKTEQSLVESLIGLKVAIEAANQAKRATIFGLSEAKSRLMFLKRIDVKRGTTMSEYGRTKEDVVEWTCEITKQDRDNLVKEEENKISNYQDELEAFNHVTIITVPDEVVNLTS